MDTDLVQISSDRECDLISSDRECDLSALARVDERGDVHVHGTDGAAELTIGVPAAYEIDVSTRDHCHVEVGGWTPPHPCPTLPYPTLPHPTPP